MQDYSKCISAIEELCKQRAEIQAIAVGRISNKCVLCLERITNGSDEVMCCGCPELFLHRMCFVTFWEEEVRILQTSQNPQSEQLKQFAEVWGNLAPLFTDKFLGIANTAIQICQDKINNCTYNEDNANWGIQNCLTCPLCCQSQEQNYQLAQAAYNRTCTFCKGATFPGNFLSYYCGCVGSNRIHSECLYELFRQSNFNTSLQLCCPRENCKERNTAVNDFTEFLQNLKYNCFVCATKQPQTINDTKQWQDVIFLECGHQTCTSCFKEHLLKLSQNKGEDLLDTGKYYPCVCDQCNAQISPLIVQNFFKSKIGRELYNELMIRIDNSFLGKMVMYKCPGFFRVKNKGQPNEEKLYSEKDTQMRRDAEEDNNVKAEFQKKQTKWLNEGYQIIECGNIFETDFTGIDSRILKCSACKYRDCKNIKCKSPHFSSTCESFQLIKDFIKNPIAKGEAQEIYKMIVNGKDYYVTPEFVQKSKANGDQIQFIKEELPNQFFKDCKLPLVLFDFNFNNEWTIKHANDNAKLFRGRIANVPIQYNYPKLNNLQGYGINIEYLYKLNKQDNKWISKRSDDDDTWISGYHGTRSIAAVQGIIKNGFQAGGGQAFSASNCSFRIGQQVGVGVYFGSNVNVALGYAPAIQIQNERYSIIFQCRLNPKTVKTPHAVNAQGAYYVINDPKDIRIYRILLIKN